MCNHLHRLYHVSINLQKIGDCKMTKKAIIHLVWIVCLIIISPCFGNEAKFQLSPDEKAWLNQNHTVRVRIGSAPPLMLTDGKIRGMAIDYLTYIFNQHGIKIHYIQESEVTWTQALKFIEQHDVVDMVPTAKITNERKKRMLFTDEYIFAPWVIFTRSKADFIGSIEDLKGKTVSVEEGYVIHEKLKRDYPKIKLKIVSAKLQNYAEMPIKDLSTGLVDGYIGNLIMTTYMIQSKGYMNVKVAAPTPFDNHNQAMAIRNDWPELASIINKTLVGMTPDEHATILNRWLSIRYEYGINKTEVIKWGLMIIFLSASILIGILYWNRRLKKEVRQRNRAEEKLKESTQYYQALFNKNRDGYAINRGSGELIDPNPAFAKMLGYSVEETKKLSFWKLTPEKWKEWEANIHGKKLLERGYTDLYEKEYIHRDGTIFPIEVQAFLLNEAKDLDSALIGAFVRDITKRKQAEEDLLKERAQLKTIINNIPVMLTRYNPDANMLYLNKEFEKIIGWKTEEVQDIDMMEKVYPDPEYRQQAMEYMQKASTEWREFKVMSKSGETIDSEWSNIRMEDGTQIGIGLDITERKKIESDLKEHVNNFNDLLDNSRTLLYKFNLKTRTFDFLGQVMETFVGISVDDYIKGGIELAVSILHPDDRDRLDEHLKNLLAGTLENDMQRTIEYRFKNARTGQYGWFSDNRAVVFDDDGKPAAIVGSIIDITERKKTEQENITLESKLRQSQKMESIGNLAGGIAHDFNNLLYPIIGFAEMLKEDLPPNSPEHESAQEIFNAGKRGGELVKQILAFSRQSEHKLSPVRFQKILAEVLKLTRSTIPSDIEIHHDIQQNCGSVMAELTQLHQIAMNLITNAYHAVENESGIISVQLKEIRMDGGELKDSPLKPGQYAMLSVSDNGFGIPRNMINNIFEPYFTTKEKGKGTGLGLAVVYGIVKEHKGDIKVYSEEGKGTTFNVYIPLMKKSAETTANDHVLVLPTGTESLLLIDDEESVIRLEKQMLERLGYQVVAQSSSIDALKLFKANPNDYDLVVTDMTMPNMTGDKLAQELMSIRPDIPIVICTGFSERINKEQAEANKVKGFLMKPVVKFEMAQMVRKVLDEAKVS